MKPYLRDIKLSNITLLERLILPFLRMQQTVDLSTRTNAHTVYYKTFNGKFFIYKIKAFDGAKFAPLEGNNFFKFLDEMKGL